jgi:alanyl-tRNA synthetase
VTSEELRQAFLDFFVARGHEIVRSASLIPHGDPTLLFTSAGMVPFKPYFLGRERPPATRLTSIQRCFRTTDIESVGDATHQTFFEMLGNFSIGDYFKREAIPWAWRFVTETLGIPRDRLWNTVFLDDDDAFNLWAEQGQRADRIVRYGVEEGNYWFSGDVGPCGPCSEIYYDFGVDTGCLQPDCEPSHSCGRFLEIWNIVFTAFNLHEDGSQSPLPAPNIDTGAGLERIASVLQHKGPGIATDYETDLLKPLVDAAVRLGDRAYGADPESDRAYRVIADHARAITFLLADGVLPSNEGRGYVLRRILRRSVYFGRRTGMSHGAMGQLVEAVLDRMSGVYPYLIEQRASVLTLATQEENRFHETLERGLQRLDELLEQLPPGTKLFPGDEAFRLYDTYGLPKELTDEIAELRGLEADDAGFEAAMEHQREQARSRASFSAASLVEASQFAALGASTRFVGYERLSESSEVVALGRSNETVGRLEAGDKGWLVLASTPFYAEGGGQVGDAGTVRSASGTFIVDDTQRREGGVIVQYGYVSEGALEAGQTAEALVDPIRRNDVTRNHTGTHMLHAALREVLGPHAHQAGSLVAPDRLRFDFTHTGQMSAEELLAVERLANDVVRQDDLVSTAVSGYDDAIKGGALAFFGEKYGDEVRVVTIANPDGQQYSTELCGGTHVTQTGKLGFVRVVSEGGIGSGVRRLEALTGRAAERWIQEQASLLERVSVQIGATPATLESRVAALVSDLEAERKHIAELQREKGREHAEELLAAAERIGPTSIVIGQTEAASTRELRELGDLLRSRLGSAAVVLGSVVEQRPQLVVQLTPDLVSKGLKAGEIIARVAEATGGRGGGRADSAQSGGNDPARLPEALQLARRILTEQLSDG